MPSSSPKYFTSHTLHRSPRRSTLFIVSCCLVIGVSGFLFGLVALFATSGRCRAVEPRSVRVAWDQSSGGVNGEWVRRKVVGFVGIQTGFESVGRRRSLRKTWMPSDSQGLQRLEEATGLAFRFIIGKTADRTKMSELRKEIAEYDDFILLDIEEEYRKLPYKTLAFFKAAYALYDADFYVKADDDIYLRPDRLSLLLAKELAPSNIPWMHEEGYEPLSPLLGNEYFLHAYGPIYALSADVVASLVALRNNSFRMFSNEDVTIGSWMLAMNVNHEDSKELCSRECTSTSIAVWDLPKCSGLCNPEKSLLELHEKDSCSKSPTLSSDE